PIKSVPPHAQLASIIELSTSHRRRTAMRNRNNKRYFPCRPTLDRVPGSPQAACVPVSIHPGTHSTTVPGQRSSRREEWCLPVPYSSSDHLRAGCVLSCTLLDRWPGSPGRQGHRRLPSCHPPL